MTKFSLLLLLAATSASTRNLAAAADSERGEEIKRIAVIGGGISGSFTAKFLSDYDDECLLDITVFEPPEDSADQGSRVSSHKLDDETTVELGAPTFFVGNRLIDDILEGDDDLVQVVGSGSRSLAIYDGHADNPVPLLLVNKTSEEVKDALFWRYNLDLWRLLRAMKEARESFDSIYDLLESTHEETFFASPNDIWRAVGLANAASASFDEYLDGIGVSSGISWWRRFLSDQGLARSELYTAMNIGENNQVNSQMTALAVLVNSFALIGGVRGGGLYAVEGTGNDMMIKSLGSLYAVEGGNDKIIKSAYQQAKIRHGNVCRTKDLYGEGKIRKIPKVVKTLVSDFEQNMELFGVAGDLLGTFDVVILAAPLQFCGINFLGKGSMFDSSVLHSLSLNEMVDSEDSTTDANFHGHKHALGTHLPSSATRPYTQVVTTFILNASINSTYFDLDKDIAPTSVLFTETGRALTGISSIDQISTDVFKVFSSEELSDDTVARVFGTGASIGYVKTWGGNRGGATPSFNGAGEASRSAQFLLYDGGHGRSSFSETSAIYYTNAMESAVSTIEISAIGSKFVSKLVARRLGLIQSTTHTSSDEL